jgi:methylated-DNA-protein-cysteine methyltransferase-like protein
MNAKVKPQSKAAQPGGSSDFFESVYEVVRCIPYGRVTTYGAIARFLGAAKSSRMVGYAMNASHLHPQSVPAHRVVNRLGLLTGKHHFPSSTAMEERLAAEGIRVEYDKVVEFDRLFWNPESLMNDV